MDFNSHLEKVDQCRMLFFIQQTQVATFKYLGVIMDIGLRCTEHLKACKCTVNSKLYLLNRIKQYMPVDKGLVVNKSVVNKNIGFYGWRKFVKKRIQKNSK